MVLVIAGEGVALVDERARRPGTPPTRWMPGMPQMKFIGVMMADTPAGTHGLRQ